MSGHYDPMDRRERAGCCCVPDYLARAAECAMSPRAFEEKASRLFSIAPNPFEQGRANQKKMWLRLYNEHANRLVWC